jgi:HSP20 family molecular chaperone IbpA
MSAKIEFNKKEFKDNHFATNFNFSDDLSIDNSTKPNLRILQKDVPIDDRDTSSQLDVTIKKNPTSICIFADLCGIDKESIDIFLVGNQLTISAYRTLLEEDREEGDSIVEELQLNEIQTGHIKKTIFLDDTIDKRNIKTSLNNGLLSLELPITKKIHLIYK